MRDCKHSRSVSSWSDKYERIMSFTVSGFNVGGSGVGAAVGVGVAVQANAISTMSASDMEDR